MKALQIDDNFSRNFLISLGVHGALILMAYLGGKAILTVFKNNDIEIIRSSVRVDIVGMPKFTVQELKELQKDADPVEPEVAKGPKEETKAPEEETPDVIKKDDIVIQEAGKEKKKNSFLNIISDYSSKKVDTKVKARGSDTGKGNKNLESLVIEGNRLSKGSALVGEFSDQANSEFAMYVQGLPERIKPHWKLPDFLMNKNLRCRLKIFLTSSGELIKLDVVEPSGDSEFDARAIKAVKAADPFPKPTDAVGLRLNSSGIILGFPI